MQGMNFAHVRIVTAFAKKMDVGHQRLRVFDALARA